MVLLRQRHHVLQKRVQVRKEVNMKVKRMDRFSFQRNNYYKALGGHSPKFPNSTLQINDMLEGMNADYCIECAVFEWQILNSGRAKIDRWVIRANVVGEDEIDRADRDIAGSPYQIGDEPAPATRVQHCPALNEFRKRPQAIFVAVRFGVEAGKRPVVLLVQLVRHGRNMPTEIGLEAGIRSVIQPVQPVSKPAVPDGRRHEVFQDVTHRINEGSGVHVGRKL